MAENTLLLFITIYTFRFFFFFLLPGYKIYIYNFIIIVTDQKGPNGSAIIIRFKIWTV